MKKIIISEKILTELNISQKNKNKYIGHGAYQYAFQSSDPEKVVKFGRDINKDEEKIIDNKLTVGQFVKRKYWDDELYEFQEMAKYPQYFPIIYRISKEYIILEKLDSNKAKSHYLAILKIIKEFDPNMTFRKLLDAFAEVGVSTKLQGNMLATHRYIREYFRETNDFSLLTPYNKFIELVVSITYLNLFGLDISPDNFGYDKKGNLKMLDV